MNRGNMAFWDKVWDFITSIIPVEDWIRAVRNVLGFLSLAFVLLFLAMVLLIVKGWGFAPTERMHLLYAVMALIGMVLVVCTLLALVPGGALYSPYERSLRRGKRYGTRLRPLTKREAEALAEITGTIGLPSPGETGELTKQLPSGESER